MVRIFNDGKTAKEAIEDISGQNTVERFSSADPTSQFLEKLGSKAPVMDTMARILMGALSEIRH